MMETPWEWQINHVYGHQDKTEQYKDLDLWAPLNVDCAGMFRQAAEWNDIDTRNIPLCKPPWKVAIQAQTI